MSFLRIALILALSAFSLVGCIDSRTPKSPNDNLGPTFAGLGDLVWLDKDQNGIQDIDEPGIEGVLVSLHDCDGNYISSDITDGRGNYELGGFDSGEYQVHFTLPENFVFTAMHADSNFTLDSDVDPATGATWCLALADSTIDLDVDGGDV